MNNMNKNTFSQGERENPTELELYKTLEVLKSDNTCLALAGRPPLKACQWGQEYIEEQYFHLGLGIQSVTTDPVFLFMLWQLLGKKRKKNHTIRKIIKIDFPLTNKPFRL